MSRIVRGASSLEVISHLLEAVYLSLKFSLEVRPQGNQTLELFSYLLLVTVFYRNGFMLNYLDNNVSRRTHVDLSRFHVLPRGHIFGLILFITS